MIAAVLAFGSAFVAMEPATAGVHRVVMHGPGWVLHRSHHRRRTGRWEANDAFPVIIAAGTVLAMAAGYRWDPDGVVVPAAFGVTAYGIAYGFVHDVYIHHRLPVSRRYRLLDRLADAHAMHHRTGAAPYGMLLPVGPRARTATRAFAHVGTRTRLDHTS